VVEIETPAPPFEVTLVKNPKQSDTEFCDSLEGTGRVDFTARYTTPQGKREANIEFLYAEDGKTVRGCKISPAEIRPEDIAPSGQDVHRAATAREYDVTTREDDAVHSLIIRDVSEGDGEDPDQVTVVWTTSRDPFFPDEFGGELLNPDFVRDFRAQMPYFAQILVTMYYSLSPQAR